MAFLLIAIFATALSFSLCAAEYVGSVSTVTSVSSIQSAGTDILNNGGGSGAFTYKGGGNAVDAAVATALASCVINPGNCSLGGYGGHMLIFKAGFDGEPRRVTCIDFNSPAGSLATSNMFAGNVDPVTGRWTGPTPAANQVGWKAAGVPGTFAGLYMAQTNYGRKVAGTNFFPFAEILKPALARVASGQVAGTAYYTLTSVSNLLMDLYTNSVGYTNINGTSNPLSSNDPYTVFYAGGIAVDLAAAMAANGGLVTYADMANYRPREVTPYMRHFSPPNGTPATVYAAPPGSAGVSVLQEVAMLEALGWTNGPNGTWDSLKYWHSRAEVIRLMWKDHNQWVGDPWGGVLPPDILGNGSTNFCDQLLAHATIGYPYACPSDPTQPLLTNSLAATITQAVESGTNVNIQVHWDDIRYGTRNITTSDRWGNCVVVTLSMGSGFGARVAVTNRALVLGQGMALFDARPGWPDSIAPGKRPVHNMSPLIVVPDFPALATNGIMGGRPPLAIGGVGGSTIENNVAMQLIRYLTDPPSSPVAAPAVWLSNFEGNKTIYMSPSYPGGVQSYFTAVGFSAPGAAPSSGQLSYVEAWIAPVIQSHPVSQDVSSGSTVTFEVTASGLPLFYQWLKNGVPLSDGSNVIGSQTAQLTLTSVASGAAYSVRVYNGASTVTSEAANLTLGGVPTIISDPAHRTEYPGNTASFSVSAIGSGPLHYRWRKNGALLTNGGNISGATNTTLQVANVSMADAALYSVVVTNHLGSVTSASGTLTVIDTNNPGQLFLYEPFNYTNLGGPVSSNTPANWTYGGSGANDLSVVSGNLFYSGLAPSIGNSVTNGGAGLGVRRLFGTNIGSGQIYFSALFRINDLGFGAWNGQSSIIGALAAPDNTTFRLQVVVKSNSPNGYVVGVQKSGTNTAARYDTVEHRAGETLFLVGRYDFTVSLNTVSLWINPEPWTFGAAIPPTSGFVTTTNGSEGFTIDRFNMRQNVATGNLSVPASLQWDELRFGTSWSSVTPLDLTVPTLKLSGLEKSDNGFQFVYTNYSSLNYNVFASTNLTNWTLIGTASQTAPGRFQFTDPNAEMVPYRYYQLRTP
jgi:gamma-glutamyltranspeptidase/glutathione hydrolase